ncbi:hypothetical protein ACFLSA_03405 [Bacteroidota bacterium]
MFDRTINEMKEFFDFFFRDGLSITMVRHSYQTTLWCCSITGWYRAIRKSLGCPPSGGQTLSGMGKGDEPDASEPL